MTSLFFHHKRYTHIRKESYKLYINRDYTRLVERVRTNIYKQQKSKLTNTVIQIVTAIEISKQTDRQSLLPDLLTFDCKNKN